MKKLGWFQRLRIATKIAGSLTQGETSTLAKLIPGGYETSAYRGVKGMLTAYSKSPWIRAVEAKISDAVGAAGWMLFSVKNAQGKYVRNEQLQNKGIDMKAMKLGALDIEGDLVQIDDHPALRLLNSSNPLFPGNVGRSQTQIQLDLTGEAHWMLGPEQYGEAIVPESFWVIPSHWIKGMPSIDKPTWSLQTPYWTGDIPQEAILRMVTPDPINPYGRGTGMFQAFGDEIDTDEYASQHVKSWFLNKARPDLLITGENLSEPDTKRIETTWLQTLQGFAKAHRPFFIGRKVDVHQLSQKFSDMELGELRKWERDIIIHGIGMPPEMLGIIENSNRSTINAADYLWSRWVITPRLELMRSFLQFQLLPLYGEDRLILAYQSPVQEDLEYQLDVMKGNPAAFRVSDWKRQAGIEPDEEDEVYLLPFSTKVVISLTEAAKAVAPAAAAIAPPPPEKTPVLAAECGCGHTHQPNAQRLLAAKSVAKIVQKDGVGGAGTADIALGLSDQMQKDIIRAFMDLRNSIDYHALMLAFDAGDIDAAMALITEADIAVSMESAVQTLKEAVVIVGEAAAAELGQYLGTALAFSLTNPEAVTFLEQFGADFVTNITPATRDAIREALRQAYADGLTPEEAAKKIREGLGLTKDMEIQKNNLIADMRAAGATEAEIEAYISKWTEDKIKWRAKLIADNELVEAGNHGQEMLWDQASDQGLIDPTKSKRQWITTPDDRTCNQCRPMEGMQTGIYEPWQTAAGPVNTPNQIHIRCRCSEFLIPKT